MSTTVLPISRLLPSPQKLLLCSFLIQNYPLVLTSLPLHISLDVNCVYSRTSHKWNYRLILFCIWLFLRILYMKFIPVFGQTVLKNEWDSSPFYRATEEKLFLTLQGSPRYYFFNPWKNHSYVGNAHMYNNLLLVLYSSALWKGKSGLQFLPCSRFPCRCCSRSFYNQEVKRCSIICWK